MGFMAKIETPATDMKFGRSVCVQSAPRLDELYRAEDAALRAWEECRHGWETRCEHRIAFDDAWRAVGVALARVGRSERGARS